jgi:DNA-binding CsgD family transcriptional regulator
VVAISLTDTAALMEIVYEGASEAGTEPFPSRVLAAIERLIPSDAFVGYEEAEFGGGSVAGFRPIEEVNAVGETPTPALIEVLREWGHQDPMCGNKHAHETRVLRLSDSLTRRQRRKLEYDALVWRPHGIDDALRLWLPARRNRVSSVYLERAGKNYTNRDLTLFSLLRPHLVRMQAHSAFRRRLNGHQGLTARESEVLGWVASGRTNADIARLLFISPHTVRKHLENIFEKLNVRTRTAAAMSARTIPSANDDAAPIQPETLS